MLRERSEDAPRGAPELNPTPSVGRIDWLQYSLPVDVSKEFEPTRLPPGRRRVGSSRAAAAAAKGGRPVSELAREAIERYLETMEGSDG